MSWFAGEFGIVKKTSLKQATIEPERLGDDSTRRIIDVSREKSSPLALRNKLDDDLALRRDGTSPSLKVHTTREPTLGSPLTLGLNSAMDLSRSHEKEADDNKHTQRIGEICKA
ncbi:unnamed protein product [Vitrella brassicaformis CCMP3155]|uniref:Uncharacterized protein n=1 Tax=Vitrella brassicaformis (strain CCMP3155) TaxID=1169540 RepID=A0A0G4FIP7_VITBC|nr:unnamed protein product [Vitrella brassicaformis CCMP3155]|eukprot:CEM13582.1 unnamed protein product [Vitrella brassicaformis CCMP3155]